MKFEKGKVFVAKELTDFTEGGVVSKELVHIHNYKLAAY